MASRSGWDTTAHVELAEEVHGNKAEVDARFSALEAEVRTIRIEHRRSASLPA